MEIKEKITIRDKENAAIPLSDLIATLKWKKAIDLDLYAIYTDKFDVEGTVYYNDRGSLVTKPFISLDHDAGVGDVGGDNEENMRIKDFKNIKHLLIVANIFAKRNAVFASYDGLVSVKGKGKEFVIPLTSKCHGNWCIIAHVDNTNPTTPLLYNINQTITEKPKVFKFLQGHYKQGNSQSEPKKKGFLSKLFGC